MENSNNISARLRIREQIRYFAVLAYMAITFAYVIYGLIIGFNEFDLVMYLMIVFGGLVCMLGIIIYPYFKPIVVEMEDKTGHSASEATSIPAQYYEEVKLRFLYYLTIPFIIIYGVVVVYYLYLGDFSQTLIFAGVCGFFLIIFVLFEKMVFLGNDDTLEITFGPFSETIQMNEIVSSKETHIKSLRSYLGYGKRIGTDGSIGYISGVSTGVRIQLSSNRSYVIASNNPRKFLEYIRTASSRSKKKSNE